MSSYEICTCRIVYFCTNHFLNVYTVNVGDIVERSSDGEQRVCVQVIVFQCASLVWISIKFTASFCCVSALLTFRVFVIYLVRLLPQFHKEFENNCFHVCVFRYTAFSHIIPYRYEIKWASYSSYDGRYIIEYKSDCDRVCVCTCVTWRNVAIYLIKRKVKCWRQK